MFLSNDSEKDAILRHVFAKLHRLVFAKVSLCLQINCKHHLSVLVYVEWAKKWSRVNFVTILGDLYKIKLWGICNNFNQFAHLSSASGPSNDVIKMAAIAQL